MFLYIILTLFFLIVLLFGLKSEAHVVADLWPILPKEKRYKNYLTICKCIALFAMLILWGLTAFRASNIGNDTDVYIYYFNIFSKFGIDTQRRFELGYQALNVLIGKVTSDPHVFLIIMASMMYICLYICIKKYSKNILITICLFYCCCFSLYTSVLRQGIAMIFVMFAYQHLKNNNKKVALLLILLATLFHTSAIVALLLFFSNKIISNKMIIVLFIVVTTLSITGVLGVAMESMIPQYEHYYNGKYAATGWLAVTIELLRNLVYYILINKALKTAQLRPSQKNIILLNFALLLIFSGLGYSVNLFTRAGEYFMLNAIIELPNTLYSSKMKNKRIWLFCICVGLMIWFLMVLIYRPNWNYLYPYEFWSS